MEQFILVITNLPDASVACDLGRQLVEKKLAACVNQLHGVRSIYRWQGAIEEADEVTLLIKTTQTRYVELEAAIKLLHPYQVPEIIVLPIVGGSKSYLDWIAQETKKDLDV
ncbi:MAG: cation tolerance protein CutA [Burkholderiales bacterium RIFCSPLOWO2_02_FULL_57_36]|nr:MAG: cation tolerance protein CutA [Burkholderiales bacterium RIFCSPLOWO2_02_FULL_57_36]